MPYFGWQNLIPIFLADIYKRNHMSRHRGLLRIVIIPACFFVSGVVFSQASGNDTPLGRGLTLLGQKK